MNRSPGDTDKDVQDNWLNSWEEQCVREVDHLPEVDELFGNDGGVATQSLYCHFQNAADALAQLYKDSGGNVGHVGSWGPFQNAATAVTTLYKESLAQSARSFEAGIQIGSAKKSKELMHWAKRKRRNVRREDLMSYLSGVKVPASLRATRNQHSVPPSKSPPRGLTMTADSIHARSGDVDLQTFTDALALQGLNGAMSNISVQNYSSRPHTPGSPSINRNRNRSTSNIINCDVRYRPIADELLHHEARKRSATADLLDPPPPHKRNRRDCL